MMAASSSEAHGLPLAITFNLGRLMVLPDGVSKASGLQEALWRLRASAAVRRAGCPVPAAALRADHVLLRSPT